MLSRCVFFAAMKCLSLKHHLQSAIPTAWLRPLQELPDVGWFDPCSRLMSQGEFDVNSGNRGISIENFVV